MTNNKDETEMIAGKSVTVRVVEEIDISAARIAARALAEGIGFRRVETFCVATSVSELANNLFFHAASGGTITMAAVRRNGDIGVEVVAEDNGPGIADVGLAMEDGFTTNGGLGGGLPGVERLMDEFEIASSAEAGTRVMARKWKACG